MIRKLILLGGALAGAVLVACSSSSGSDVEVQPIDDIIVAPIQITDLTSSSAVMRVDTTIDVACSVVYGTDESYGMQSVDLDMAGQGHRNHMPLMRGLEPDTEYHFRVQGSSADGTLYVSESMTFRTPAAKASGAEVGENLASAAAGATIVDASSTFGGSATWAPENAIDEDPGTEWSSQGDGDEAFVTVSLAEASEVAAVGLWTRTMGSSAEIIRFQVVVDGGEVLGPFEMAGAGSLQTFPVEATGQEFRFEVVESSGGNTGAVEIAVLAPAP